MACVFEKDVIYYRANIVYSGGIDTSAYLGEYNGVDDNALNMNKIALEIKNFIKDADAKSIEIVKYEAQAGDGLAHESGVILRLARDASGAIIAE